MERGGFTSLFLLLPMKINICAHTTGIGDHVSAIYAACGLADAGHEVTFYTRHFKWLERVQHPGVKVFDWIGPNYRERRIANVYNHYEDELVAAVRGTCPSRPQWYIDNIAEYYGIPTTTPSTPSKILGPAMPYHGKPYVLFAPFSAGTTRAWEDDKWQYLAELLVGKGLEVIAVSSNKEAPALQPMLGGFKGVRLVCGKEPSEVIDLIQQAHMIVGNDSSIPHLAALHKVHAICVMSHIKPEFVFGPGVKYIKPVHPDPTLWDCIWCAWTHEGGFREFCLERCDALQSIEPEQVITLFRG